MTSVDIHSEYDKITFNEKLIRCPFESCYCPTYHYDSYLFKKAKKETKSKTLPNTYLIKDLAREYLNELIVKHLPNSLRKSLIYFSKKHNL